MNELAEENLRLTAEVELLQAELRTLQHTRLLSVLFLTRDEGCPLPFALIRNRDVTGVSGEGTVAYGVQFADGQVVIRWLGEYASTVVWESLDKAMHVHGHDGATRVVWLAEYVADLAAEETALDGLLAAANGVLAEVMSEDGLGHPWNQALRRAVDAVPDSVRSRQEAVDE